ncbi:MAG: hypothetical protein JW841_05200 [Deltaproteobacteria bacterium]|nr:hypothetical protein [Deltaproteobacteria bacterium]
MKIIIAPEQEQQRFTSAIIGHKIGDRFFAKDILPKEFPLASYRAKKVDLLLHITNACELTYLEQDSPEFLKRIKVGNSLEQLFSKLSQIIIAERRQEQRMIAAQKILDQLAKHYQLRVPPALINDEIKQAWTLIEKPLLDSEGITAAEQQSICNTWQNSANLRHYATKSIARILSLYILARDGVLTIEQHHIDSFIKTLFKENAGNIDELSQIFPDYPKLVMNLLSSTAYLLLLEQLLVKVIIT